MFRFHPARFYPNVVNKGNPLGELRAIAIEAGPGPWRLENIALIYSSSPRAAGGQMVVCKPRARGVWAYMGTLP